MKLTDMVMVPEKDAWVVSVSKNRLAVNEKTGMPFFGTEEEAREVAKVLNGSAVRLSMACQVKQSIDKG